MNRFHAFLESLKTKDNSSLIESIQQGYTACFEAFDEDDLTREEWIKYKRDQSEIINKPPGTLSLTGPYPKVIRPLPNQENPIYHRQTRYAKNPEISKIRRNLIAKYGGFDKIHNWQIFQAELNRELKRKGLLP